MAKTSKIVKQRQRAAIVAHYAQRRADLKRLARTAGSFEERDAAARALRRLPRDASPTRLRNRDATDGRPRAYLRAFGLSRLRVRELAHRGELPGVRKSSW